MLLRIPRGRFWHSLVVRAFLPVTKSNIERLQLAKPEAPAETMNFSFWPRNTHSPIQTWPVVVRRYVDVYIRPRNRQMKINPPGCRSNCRIRPPNMEYSLANYPLAIIP